MHVFVYFLFTKRAKKELNCILSLHPIVLDCGVYYNYNISSIIQYIVCTYYNIDKTIIREVNKGGIKTF